MSFHGRIEKGMVVLDQPLLLPDGTRVRIEAIVPAPTDFWQSLSLDELARQQGVSATGSLEDLLGGWPMEELSDEFEVAYLDWRNRELEPRP